MAALSRKTVSIESGGIKMKNVLKQSGKALCYFLTYMGCQLIATVITMLVCQFIIGVKMGMAGETQLDTAKIVEETQTMVFGNMGIVLLINVLLALGIYLIVMKIRKHRFTEEVSLKKISFKMILLSVMASVGSIGLLNFGLELIPLPEELVEGFVSGNSQLMSIPLWQSVVCTAILVPIMEEIVFRGFVFSRLDKAMPTVLAVIITSVLFGAIHGSILWAAWAAAVGVVLNIVRIKSGSLIPAIILHVCNNTSSLILSEVGSEGLDKYAPFITVAGLVILTTAIILISKERKREEAKADVSVEVITASV